MPKYSHAKMYHTTHSGIVLILGSFVNDVTGLGWGFKRIWDYEPYFKKEMDKNKPFLSGRGRKEEGYVPQDIFIQIVKE